MGIVKSNIGRVTIIISIQILNDFHQRTIREFGVSGAKHCRNKAANGLKIDLSTLAPMGAHMKLSSLKLNCRVFAISTLGYCRCVHEA